MATFSELYEAVRRHDCLQVRRLIKGGLNVNCRDSMRRTVLHHAASRFCGDMTCDVIRTLVDLGADVNAMDIEKKPPLCYALSLDARIFITERVTTAFHCHHIQQMNQIKEWITERSDSYVAEQVIKAVEQLVELGADINARFDVNTKSLHRAIRLEKFWAMEILLRLGVDVNAIRYINCAVLHFAQDPSGMSEKNVLKRLVELGADINSSYCQLEPLHEAVALGRMEMIKILIEYNADIDGIRHEGIIPVLCALGLKSAKTVEYLSELGADLNVCISYSHMVNEIVKTGRTDILEYMARNGNGPLDIEGKMTMTPLGYAITNYPEMVECLLRSGADVNVRFDLVIPPVMVAMRKGEVEMMKALARLGDIDAQPLIENITALYYTAGYSTPDIMKLLIGYGGDVNLKYDLITTPVHEAVALGQPDMLTMLAELGADLNACKNEGVSLLRGSGYNMFMTEVLVEAGIDLNASYYTNVTPLHDAVRLGTHEVVLTLGKLNADMNAVKKETRPLDKAIRDGMVDMIRYLAEQGADLDKPCTVNIRPMHDAVHYHNTAVLESLIKCGADTREGKATVTPLIHAIGYGQNDVVKTLVELGADVNATHNHGISPLHDVIEKVDDTELAHSMITILKGASDQPTARIEKVTALDESVKWYYPDITETLLKYDTDINCFQSVLQSPVDDAIARGRLDCALLLKCLWERKQPMTPWDSHHSTLHASLDMSIKHGC